MKISVVFLQFDVYFNKLTVLRFLFLRGSNYLIKKEIILGRGLIIATLSSNGNHFRNINFGICLVHVVHVLCLSIFIRNQNQRKIEKRGLSTIRNEDATAGYYNLRFIIYAFAALSYLWPNHYLNAFRFTRIHTLMNLFSSTSVVEQPIPSRYFRAKGDLKRIIFTDSIFPMSGISLFIVFSSTNVTKLISAYNI